MAAGVAPPPLPSTTSTTHQSLTQLLSSPTFSPSHLPLPRLLTLCSTTPSLLPFAAQLHALSYKLRLSSDLYIQTSLLSLYSSHSHLDHALRVFDRMPHRTVVSWTALLNAFLRVDRLEDSLGVFCEMREFGVVPDGFALVGLLAVCSRAGILGLGRAAHCYVEKMGSGLDAGRSVIRTALVDMYCKCGDVGDAVRVFDEVPVEFRTVRLWNAILHGLAVHGRGAEAAELFGEMVDEGRVRPNEVTFVAVLCGCAHSGMVAEGRCYFELMRRKYGIEPTEKHYGCMVDLLGRAGLLDEAFEVVSGMPIAANLVVWGALISACKVHDNVGMAERVMERVEHEDWPVDDTSRYVIMSDLYKKAGLLEKHARVRKMVGKKPKGRSWIETGNNVHIM